MDVVVPVWEAEDDGTATPSNDAASPLDEAWKHCQVWKGRVLAARDALGLSFGDVDILSAIRKLLERQRATPAKENAS